MAVNATILIHFVNQIRKGRFPAKLHYKIHSLIFFAHIKQVLFVIQLIDTLPAISEAAISDDFKTPSKCSLQKPAPMAADLKRSLGMRLELEIRKCESAAGILDEAKRSSMPRKNVPRGAMSA
ncbi:hypothetical protein [Mucilaginibacter aquaedulcis]|uniref:hypothetical protein n=1 Tax=Mucilaginibacter aquaedulcis TaxID=1187081 RepID=UPI0025B60231|nr:hypothetical protein [Mucilaginibacter aquaedulcis]MDN3550200.1 hypothetical protein [Mucilaginibacter aquaedulcis]